MKRAVIAAAVLAFVTAACGRGHEDHASASTRTVEIEMVDIAFRPATLAVQRGERVELVFHNRGKIPHDAFIGDTAAQAEHEQGMRQSGQDTGDGGHGMHGGGDAITVDPGKTGRLTHTFERTGTIEIGCHQPGHYAAGMKVAVAIA